MAEISNDICAHQIERMIREAGATGHAGLVLRSFHDATAKSQAAYIAELQHRCALVEATLKSCIPFLAIYMDRYKRDYQLTELHPKHAGILDRASHLTGGEILSENLKD
jgi:hypothetical protein